MITAVSLVAEFRAIVEEIVGLFHDARLGFRRNLDALVETQRRFVDSHPDHPEFGSIKQLDAKLLYYETGRLGDPGSMVQHVSTQAEYKVRNADNGANYRVVGSLCTVMVYNYWEDHYRQQIALALGHDSKNALKAPIFGDMRRLRNSIVHHRGIALGELERCELLRWFHEGDPIVITEKKFDEMVGHIRSYLDGVAA